MCSKWIGNRHAVCSMLDHLQLFIWTYDTVCSGSGFVLCIKNKNNWVAAYIIWRDEITVVSVTAFCILTFLSISLIKEKHRNTIIILMCNYYSFRIKRKYREKKSQYLHGKLSFNKLNGRRRKGKSNWIFAMKEKTWATSVCREIEFMEMSSEIMMLSVFSNVNTSTTFAPFKFNKQWK